MFWEWLFNICMFHMWYAARPCHNSMCIAQVPFPHKIPLPFRWCQVLTDWQIWPYFLLIRIIMSLLSLTLTVRTRGEQWDLSHGIQTAVYSTRFMAIRTLFHTRSGTMTKVHKKTCISWSSRQSHYVFGSSHVSLWRTRTVGFCYVGKYANVKKSFVCALPNAISTRGRRVLLGVKQLYDFVEYVLDP